MVVRTLTDLLEAAFPGDEVAVEDRTGGGNHFQVTVSSARFSSCVLAISGAAWAIFCVSASRRAISTWAISSDI